VILTPAEAVHRARSAVGHRTRYQLGAGGMNPYAPLPSDGGKCDCSGFVSWTLGMSREQPKTIGWIETTRVYHDATAAHRLFKKVTAAQPGDVIVYPDQGGHQGHIGLITKASNGVPVEVAHCCARDVPDAVIVEPYAVFWQGAKASRGAIFARFLEFEEEEDLEKLSVTVNGHAYVGRRDAAQNENYLPLEAVKAFLVAKGAQVVWVAPNKVAITLPKA
jgi:hypothetical protein